MTSTRTTRAIEQCLLAGALLLTVAACSVHHPEVPASYDVTTVCAPLLPDYAGVTIPPNLSPLNFSVADDSIEGCVAVLQAGTLTLTAGEEKGHRVIIDPDDWHDLVREAVGDSIHVTLYTRRNGCWRLHPAFGIEVVADSIDPYVAYRRIPPYNTYERMRLCQRELLTGREWEFYNNQMLDAPRGGHCVNCHAFQAYRTERMQFHVREELAGTVLTHGKEVRKVPLRNEGSLSAGVYPSWHPTLPLVAYSENRSFMEFHTNGLCKSEVQDSDSRLMLYDADHDRIVEIEPEEGRLETFPSWSPDGRWLYYCSARFDFDETRSSATSDEVRRRRQQEVNSRYREVRYDICRRPFDPDAYARGVAGDSPFGPAERVLEASLDSLSATLPRISPDGRWLLTCVGDYGGFLIYHPEAELAVVELDEVGGTAGNPVDGTRMPVLRRLGAANAPLSADSYHSWSSSGRWIVFQSRRRDDNYTRLYVTYFDREGGDHKAFELPQADPDYELRNMESYNLPEFVLEEVRQTPADFAKAIFNQ